jgi:two-component system chemotaxis response regulator CheY
VAVREIIKFDPNAKIIMVSSMGQVGLVIEAMQAGAKDFVSKPFNASRVSAAVKKALHGEDDSAL